MVLVANGLSNFPSLDSLSLPIHIFLSNFENGSFALWISWSDSKLYRQLNIGMLQFSFLENSIITLKIIHLKMIVKPELQHCFYR